MQLLTESALNLERGENNEVLKQGLKILNT